MRSRGEILSVHRISYSYFQRIECIIKGAFKLQGNEKTRTVAFSCSCHQQLLTIKVTVEGIPVLLVTKKPFLIIVLAAVPVLVAYSFQCGGTPPWLIQHS